MGHFGLVRGQDVDMHVTFHQLEYKSACACFFVEHHIKGEGEQGLRGDKVSEDLQKMV